MWNLSPHISRKQIGGLEFKLPPDETQRKISGVLANYNDLIDTNERRIELLDDMSRSILDVAVAKHGVTTALVDVAEVNALSVKKEAIQGNIEYVDISSVGR